MKASEHTNPNRNPLILSPFSYIYNILKKLLIEV